MRMLMILISRQEEQSKEKEVGGIKGREDANVVHRAPRDLKTEAGNLTNRDASEFSCVDFSRRQKGQEQEGLGFEHFSSSRSERNRTREKEERREKCTFATASRSREKSPAISLNWCFHADNVIGWSRECEKPITRLVRPRVFQFYCANLAGISHPTGGGRDFKLMI